LGNTPVPGRLFLSKVLKVDKTGQEEREEREGGEKPGILKNGQN